jgi:hypothetical protein
LLYNPHITQNFVIAKMQFLNAESCSKKPEATDVGEFRNSLMAK